MDNLSSVKKMIATIGVVVVSLFILVYTISNSDGESKDKSIQTVQERAQIIAVDTGEGTWGRPKVITTIATEKGFMDKANARIGDVGDTLQVNVLYVDGEFMGVQDSYSTLINLSKQMK